MSTLFRGMAYAGLVLSFIWSFTKKQYDWMAYVGFTLMVVGLAYTMIDNWQKGHRTIVLIQLLFLTVAAVYIYFRFR